MPILCLDLDLQKKIPTSNNLIKLNQPNDPICKLYMWYRPGNPIHLCKDYIFTLQVWSILKQWLGLSMIDTVKMTRSLHGYWRKCQSKIDKEQRREFYGIIIYFLVERLEEAEQKNVSEPDIAANEHRQCCCAKMIQSGASWQQERMSDSSKCSFIFSFSFCFPLDCFGLGTLFLFFQGLFQSCSVCRSYGLLVGQLALAPE